MYNWENESHDVVQGREKFYLKSHYLGLFHSYTTFSFKAHRYVHVLGTIYLNTTQTHTLFDISNLYYSVLGYPEYHVFNPLQSIFAEKNHCYPPQREFSLATKVLWRENPLQTYTLSDKFLLMSHYEWVELTYILASWGK